MRSQQKACETSNFGLSFLRFFKCRFIRILELCLKLVNHCNFEMLTLQGITDTVSTSKKSYVSFRLALSEMTLNNFSSKHFADKLRNISK